MVEVVLPAEVPERVILAKEHLQKHQIRSEMLSLLVETK